MPLFREEHRRYLQTDVARAMGIRASYFLIEDIGGFSTSGHSPPCDLARVLPLHDGAFPSRCHGLNAPSVPTKASDFQESAAPSQEEARA